MLKRVNRNLATKPTATKPKILGPTERRWASHKNGNALAMLTVLQDNNNFAFDILVDLLSQGDQAFHEAAINLDDMNIRGEQIEIAFAFCNGSLTKFRKLVAERSPEMIKHINTNWKRAPYELAVPRGAHMWMHKKIVNPV